MIPEKILKSKILTQLPKILFNKANKLKIRIKLLYLVKKIIYEPSVSSDQLKTETILFQ